VPSRHPLFVAIVLMGTSLTGCKTQPLDERKGDLALADLAHVDLAKIAGPDLSCDCVIQPLPQHCQLPCILI
jgi:hypothetical protein